MADLLREIAGVDQDITLGERLTTREIMDALGLGSMQAARRRIRPLVLGGVLTAGRKRVKSIAGVETSVPAYFVNPSADWEEALDLLSS
jgi:hypothetical protein